MYEWQERLLTSCTKFVIDHAPTNAYILNTHSLHNYHWINSVLPASIHTQCSSPLIPEHTSLCLRAAGSLQSKKGSDHEEENAATNLDEAADPPPFDQVKNTRRKNKAKGKAKATPPPVQLATGRANPEPPNRSYFSDSNRYVFLPPVVLPSTQSGQAGPSTSYYQWTPTNYQHMASNLQIGTLSSHQGHIATPNGIHYQVDSVETHGTWTSDSLHS